MEKVSLFSFLKKYWPFVVLGLFLLFLYTFNLEKNSRFIWDESRALVDMHRIWEQKLVTFVGPISQDNLEMFPSLSYYMYLPGAILTKFDPLGSVYMATFFSLLGWIILTATIVKAIGISLKSFLFSFLFGSLAPVVVVSRWAWNPNLVIFWVTLFISSLFYESAIVLFIGGVSLGATMYHHYLALLGVIPALLFLPIFYKNNKLALRNIFFILAGFIFSIIPFALFEFKNHYFINSSSFLASNEKSFTTISFNGYWERVWSSIEVFLGMFLPSNPILALSLIAIFIGIFVFYKSNTTIRYSFLSLALSFLLFGFITVTYPHYQYFQVGMAMLMLFAFISVNQGFYGKILIALLIVSALYQSVLGINKYDWQGDISAVRSVTNIVSSEMESKVNVATLSSRDPNTTGQRYRDMLLIKGKTLDSQTNYSESKVLYVVSESPDTDKIRQDPAWEMQPFRDGIISHSWKVSDYPIYLFRFQKQL